MTENIESQLDLKAELSIENKELKQWLQKSNCQQYYHNFVENGITVDLLSELDTDSLLELGVTKLGDRLRLELAIASLKSEKLTNTLTYDSLSNLLTQCLQELNQERLSNLGFASDGGGDDGVVSGEVSSRLYTVDKDKDAPKERDSKTVTFILQDGSTKKVNVTGCFNAQSIKRKVLRKLGFRSQDPQYDVYIHNTLDRPPFLLYDVELVTICYSPDRLEKHRILFVPQGEVPSDASLKTSKRILNKYENTLHSRVSNKNLNQYRIIDQKSTRGQPLRNFFGQRPPSELISSNLAEYFPETKEEDLEATIRNSVRYNVRLSKRLNMIPGLPSSSDSTFSSKRMSILSASTSGKRRLPSKTIGDVMVGGYTAIDQVVSSNNDNQLIPSSRSVAKDSSSAKNISSSASSIVSNSNDARSIISTSKTFVTPKIQIAASFTDNSVGNRNSRIELLHVDSDSDDEDVFAGYYDEDDLDIESISEEGPKNWIQGARIGAGSFGTVYLGMNALTGELMAVKQIPLPNANTSQDVEKSMIEQQREMTLLKQLNHENIVRYYGSSTDETSLNIFLEYVPGGSVQSMLKSYGPFEEPLIRNFVRQVLIGLSYLHGEDIIHRDVKGANILIDIKGKVKIGDFGISRKVNQIEDEVEKKSSRRVSLQGSVYWMAPEVVKQTAYTKKADIWSVGCLVVEMFTGKHPFPEFSQMQAIFKIGTNIPPQIPEWSTEEAKQFLNKTFEIDYKQRPDAVDLLSEPFLTPLIMSKN